MTKSRGILAPRVVFTDAEKEIVRRLYPTTKNSEIVKLLGRHNEDSIGRAARRLGVKKCAEYLREMGGYLDGHRGAQKRFQPGHVPWIAGKKLPGKTSSTSFVKGQRAPNWMPLGAHKLSSGGHLVRKIRDGNNGGLNWEAVYRLVWKEANGPIPKGHVIVFRPGTKTVVLEEITVDRLDCITRAENARRNSLWTSDPELMKLYCIKGAITRHVNRISKESKNV